LGLLKLKGPLDAYDPKFIRANKISRITQKYLCINIRVIPMVISIPMSYKPEWILNRRDLQVIGSLGSIGLTMVESKTNR